MVECTGIPLAVLLTAANRHDSVVFEELLDGIQPIKRPRGRPRKRPAKLHADKAYDIPRCRQALTRRHIKIRIARKGIESSEKLGCHRWVVERTLAWLVRYRLVGPLAVGAHNGLSDQARLDCRTYEAFALPHYAGKRLF